MAARSFTQSVTLSCSLATFAGLCIVGLVASGFRLFANYSTAGGRFGPPGLIGSRSTCRLERGIMNIGRLFAMELLGKSKNELRDFCTTLGEPAYRGGQINHALYAERKSEVRQVT